MLTILFVDDSRAIRDFCRREFEKDGYRVLTAAGGEEALYRCRTDPPDLVVLDLQMPGLDGVAVAGRIARERLAIPVVFFTSDGEPVRDDLSRWPAVACVPKSADLSELKGEIARALEGSARKGYGGGDAAQAEGEGR